MSTVVEHLPKKGSMKLTMDRGLSDVQYSLYLHCHPHKNFARLETLVQCSMNCKLSDFCH